MEKSTLYITYSLNELEGVGGVVSAILAGLMRDHMASGHKWRLLVAIDEMAAVRMRHLDTYLATVGGFGITMLLYAQSMSQ
jgi:type IV secretory pathway TraG/TraD family ATPase VirD4